MTYHDKYSKAIRRFPTLYRLQAEKAIDISTRDAVRTSVDATLCSVMLVLINDFGWGSAANSTRIPELMHKVQDMLDSRSVEYDSAVAVGLIEELRRLGVQYVAKDGGGE